MIEIPALTAELPTDATGEYQDYKGDHTWVKDVDLRKPAWPIARVWSFTTKRWRKTRERVVMERLRMYPTPSTARVP